MATSNESEHKTDVLGLHIIWLDAQGLDSEDNRKTQRELSKNFGRCCLEKNGAGCQTIVDKNFSDTKFELIVSGQIGQEFVPKIHTNPKISSIYVFCQNKAAHEVWSKNYDKVRCNFQLSEFRIILFLFRSNWSLLIFKN